MSSTSPSSTEQVAQALFCVATDDVVNGVADEASGRTQGCVFFGAFREYISAEKRPQFSPALKNAKSCVALVDFDRDPSLALKTVERLSQIFLKRVSIVGVGSSMDATLLLQAMRAGCVEFLTRPVEMTDLSAALTRFQESMQVSLQAQGTAGRIIAFFGAKGGVGATTLAVHLATFLVLEHKKKVLLIDHKHQLGHVALYLGLKDTQYHFTELVRSSQRLDRELLEGFVMQHKSGLEVIASPENAAFTPGGTRDDLDRVIDFLRLEYDYILVDSSVGYEESKMSLIDQSDEINLISTPDVAALRDLARLVENMSLNEAGMNKLRLVINRATANDSISSQHIQKAIRFPVSLSIANSYFEVMRAINAGEPVIPDNKSGFSQQISGWAHQIAVGEAMSATSTASRRKFAFWRPKSEVSHA